MSKLKFYKKWKGDQTYSPTHEWEHETSSTVENIIEEPSSPLPTYSLTFNEEKWIIPIDDDDMGAENFLHPRTSSPIPGKDILYSTILKHNVM